MALMYRDVIPVPECGQRALHLALLTWMIRLEGNNSRICRWPSVAVVHEASKDVAISTLTIYFQDINGSYFVIPRKTLERPLWHGRHSHHVLVANAIVAEPFQQGRMLTFD